VLYEMLTGAKLFTGESLAQVLHNVATFDPPPPSRIRPEISQLLDLVVKRAIAKKKEDRYANAWEMVNDLQLCLQELAPARYSAELAHDMPEQGVAPSAAGEDEKTVILKSPADSGSFNARRISAHVETSNRMTLASRIDSSKAYARLQTPGPRDLKRLSRVPKAPGFLLRLLHDRDLAWLSISLVASLLLAAALVLT